MSEHEERMARGHDVLKQMGWPDTAHDWQEAIYTDLAELTVGHLFGNIWSRGVLSLRDREMITLAAGVAQARPHGMAPHLRGAKNLGITHEEIVELIIHVGQYAGWPTIAHAVRQYAEMLAEDGIEPPRHPRTVHKLAEKDESIDRGFEVLEQMGWPKEAMLDQRDLYPDLYELTVGYLFGEIWARGVLSLRDRELITIAAGVALARPHGMPPHLRNAKHLGITREEIMELIIQVGHYAGWPTIAHAVRQLSEVLAEDGELEDRGA